MQNNNRDTLHTNDDENGGFTLPGGLEKLTTNMKRAVIELYERIPEERRAAFKTALRDHGQDLLSGETARGALIGFVAGLVLDVLPLGLLTGVDNWKEIGLLAGAAWGYLSSREKRRLAEWYATHVPASS